MAKKIFVTTFCIFCYLLIFGGLYCLSVTDQNSIWWFRMITITLCFIAFILLAIHSLLKEIVERMGNLKLIGDVIEINVKDKIDKVEKIKEENHG